MLGGGGDSADREGTLRERVPPDPASLALGLPRRPKLLRRCGGGAARRERVQNPLALATNGEPQLDLVLV